MIRKVDTHNGMPQEVSYMFVSTLFAPSIAVNAPRCKMSCRSIRLDLALIDGIHSTWGASQVPGFRAGLFQHSGAVVVEQA
jgi:hypothetical protein